MPTSRVVAPFISSDHQHAYCLESSLLKAEQSCIRQGLRLTPIRPCVLELVWKNHEPVKAYDILETIKAEKKGAAPPTVYRALNFLQNEGFVHKIESLNSYVGCGEPGHNNTAQFFICNDCGVVAKLDDGDIYQLIDERASRLGFRSRRLIIEVEGLCTECHPD